MIWGGMLCVCCLSVLKAYQTMVCPRGMDVLRDLELDDRPDQRFDGIENALFERLRDPWNYIALPTINRHQEAKSDEDIRLEDTAAAIRDAANLLRTRCKDKTEGASHEYRPDSATIVAKATALASSSVLARRGSNASASGTGVAMASPGGGGRVGGEGRAAAAATAAVVNKWDVWNDIAEGKASCFVGTEIGNLQAADSARSDDTSNSAGSAHSYFGLSTADLHPTDVRFGQRQVPASPADQWSSRPLAKPKPLGLSLDLSNITVAPPNILPPRPLQQHLIVQEPPKQLESLKFDTAEDDEYTMDQLPGFIPAPSKQYYEKNQSQVPAEALRVAQLGPPAHPSVRLGPPPGRPQAGAPRGPLGMLGPGGRVPPPPRGPPPASLGAAAIPRGFQ